MNRRAASRLRVDGQLPANSFQPLRHAGQAKPAPSYRLVMVKAGARILDCQVEGVELTAERDVGMSRPAVLDDILQGFLKDAVETQ